MMKYFQNPRGLRIFDATASIQIPLPPPSVGVPFEEKMGTMLADWLAGKNNDTIEYLLSLPKPEWNPPDPFLTMGVNFTLRRGMHNAGLEA